MNDENMVTEQLSDDAEVEDEMSKHISISDDEINAWWTELQGIDGKIAALNERKSLLQRMLAALSEIDKVRNKAPREPDAAVEKPESDTAAENSGDVALTEAIPAVLEKYRRPMTPAEIKDHLREVGYLRPVGKNYFYTAIARAVEKNRIRKTDDKRYFAGSFANPTNVTLIHSVDG